MAASPAQVRTRQAGAVQSGSEGFEEVVADGTLWRVDRAFMRSNWTCIWGRGCLGILAEPAEDLQQGCCSVGAHLDGPDEAGAVSTLAEMIEPERFQFHAEAADGGVVSKVSAEPAAGSLDAGERLNTRLVDDACIFLNRPGFPGGAGCALHLQAEADGERPIDWKPSVCWQLPIHVEWVSLDPPGTEGGREQATVAAWTRADWGDDGDPMHWCCTEGDRAYVGESPVIESLGEELEAIVGREVYVELRRRLG